jgi:hypothetical protein
MDFKVSRKEKRFQSDGVVEVLLDNIFDLYPIFGDDKRFDDQDIYVGQDLVTSIEERADIIMDVEILDDDRDEMLDRALFALVKQRGGDPTEPSDGIQWAEAVLGEVEAPLIIQQIHSSVGEEGPGVRSVPSVIRSGGKERLFFKVELTNAA